LKNHAGAAPEFPTPEIRAVMQAKVVDPLNQRTRPLETFSRMPLLPPVTEAGIRWCGEVEPGVHGFEINRNFGLILRGLVSRKTQEVWLLDPATKTYVPAAEHPAIRADK
jgi:hypothetical protein